MFTCVSDIYKYTSLACLLTLLLAKLLHATVKCCHLRQQAGCASASDDAEGSSLQLEPKAVLGRTSSAVRPFTCKISW